MKHPIDTLIDKLRREEVPDNNDVIFSVKFDIMTIPPFTDNPFVGEILAYTGNILPVIKTQTISLYENFWLNPLTNGVSGWLLRTEEASPERYPGIQALTDILYTGKKDEVIEKMRALKTLTPYSQQYVKGTGYKQVNKTPTNPQANILEWIVRHFSQYDPKITEPPKNTSPADNAPWN